jgi:hypothetical protein
VPGSISHDSFVRLFVSGTLLRAATIFRDSE